MRAVHADLKNLLSPEEWKTAAATTPNAHYTSMQVIQGMWAAIERLGIKAGASILEPSMGSGNFLGLIPDALLPNTKLAGVELDPVTARIAALLYPNAGTYASGFEKTRFPNNWFDLALSNVPFGNYGVHDAAFKGERRALTSSIHNYFFAKALDKVRPGGIVAFITSRYTMDTANPAVREYLTKEAKLLGAIRLPQTAFEANAGTTVVTDMIFLQKGVPGDASPGESWTQAPETNLFPGDQDNPRQNEYYTRHPEMILGTVKGNRGRFGPEINVLGKLDPDKLTEALRRLPENVVTERKATEAFNPEAIAIAEYPEAGQDQAGRVRLARGQARGTAGRIPRTGRAGQRSHTAGYRHGGRARCDARSLPYPAHRPAGGEDHRGAEGAEQGLRPLRFEVRPSHRSRQFAGVQERSGRATVAGAGEGQPQHEGGFETDIFTEATLHTYKPVTSAGTGQRSYDDLAQRVWADQLATDGAAHRARSRGDAGGAGGPHLPRSGKPAVGTGR